MQDWEIDALARRVVARKNGGSTKTYAQLAHQAVRGVGISHPSDVTRLAREICSRLGEHGRTVQAANRALAGRLGQ